ncbi:hypothetical protein ACHAXR_010797 [Thalassiosira sp. AJA248-18]
MPSVLSAGRNPPPLDPEWAESFRGLLLLVTDSWLPDYDGNKTSIGEIDTINFTNMLQRFFNVIIDGHVYCMRYDAIFLFADDSQRGFDRFHLPRHPVSNLEGETWSRRSQQSQGVSGDANAGSGSSEEEEEEGHVRYIQTDPVDWICVDDGSGQWMIRVNITDAEVDSFKDHSGDIRFDKVLECSLPRFVLQPKRRPCDNRGSRRLLLRHHACRSITGSKSIEDIWSMRSVHKANAPIKDCMPQDAVKDLCRCMHFADDWEEDDTQWNDFYDDSKEYIREDTANHRQKFGMLEDAYNAQWQAMVLFGRCMTADESPIAGWYHSPMTMGPEPKPIRTVGCTLHTLCVTYGTLAMYKLFARAYSSKTDSALDHRNKNTNNTQKWVNLYDIMPDPFKGAGRCVTMDSAYMGDKWRRLVISNGV